MSGCRTVRIALAGCGTVGGELARTLLANESWLRAEYGVQTVLTRVLVRDVTRTRAVRLPPGVLTADLDGFLSAEADVIVEAMGGVEPAATLAAAARARGLPFVTANKALIAARGESLVAGPSGCGLWFDAAVAGGVPVVRVIRDYLGRGRVRRICGILNGTSNYVLTRIERGDSFGVALDDARRCGFAEADCTRDLDGRDAADKIAILAWLGFGVRPSNLHVEVRGILPDPERLVRGASAAGGRVRLLAECSLENARIATRVEPVVVPPDSVFGRTVNEENRILIDAGWPWPIELAGPGAGGAPTAAALLADLLQATLSAAPSRLVGARSVANAVDIPHGVSSDGARRFLVGVAGGRARGLRVSFAAAGVPSEIVGAAGGDAWLATAPIRRSVLDGVLAAGVDGNGGPAPDAQPQTEAHAVVMALHDDPATFAVTRNGSGPHWIAPRARAGVA